jgi:hypothetical protein
MNHRQVFLFEQSGGVAIGSAAKTDAALGSRVLGFDTGLSSRAFAQAKFAQVITEPGLIVRSGAAELWKASGVLEFARTDGEPTMVVWGRSFEGEHLDLLLEKVDRRDSALKDRVVAAICCWIRAILAVGKTLQTDISFWPCAAIIGEGAPSNEGRVFFAPPSLILRCLMGPGEPSRFSGGEWYVHPDLEGMDAAAFTAAAMLYRVFAAMPPFPAVDELLLHQDMRDGNFLPVHFAVPGLDNRLTALIHHAIVPPEKRTRSSGHIARVAGNPDGAAVLDGFLAILQPVGQPVLAASLIQPLSDADSLALEKEKGQFLKVHTASIKTRRFIARNTAILFGSIAGMIIAAIIAYNVISTRADLPTTAGMEPPQVIASYYNAFGDLDHQMMEACVTRGAGKDDITTAINFFVISKVRQAYEYSALSNILSAQKWQEEGGGPVDRPVYGITDLHIEQIAAREDTGTMRYRADYTLWVPGQISEEPPERGAPVVMEPIAVLPRPYHRSDIITVTQRRGNWRISEIIR